MNSPTKAERLARLLNNLAALGFSYSEAQRLRRIEMTLARWSTDECNGEIVRDEETEKPSRVSRSYTQGNGSYMSWPIPDRETGALKRLATIMEAHPDLWSYHQGDPRGTALYVGRKADLPKMDKERIARLEGDKAAATPASRLRATVRQYYTNGVAVSA